MTEQRRVAWITGGGSGLGEAIAERLAADGLHVVVSGRREGELARVVAQIAAAGGSAEARPVDVTDADEVRAVAENLGRVDVLVCSAGGNVGNRWWDDLTPADFARVVDLNLTSVANCALGVLPAMRAAQDGLIVVVSSWAGWRYESIAGAAYTAAKRALSGLTESINDQEGGNFIRATLLCPGEARTAILASRPVPPSPEQMEQMLLPEHIAGVVGHVASLPKEVCINELVVTPSRNRFYHSVSAHHGA